MRPSPDLKLPWRWIICGWLLVALAWTPASMLVNARHPGWTDFTSSLLANGLTFASWALATPIIFRLCARYPLGDHRSIAHSALLLALGVIIIPMVSGLFPFLQTGLPLLANGGPAAASFDPTRFAQRVLITSLFALPTYLAVVAIGQTLVWAARARRQATEAAGAELRALRAELNPHFLFNTLTGIGRLAHHDPDRANQAIQTLSEVLRASLSEQAAEQTLAEAIGEAEEHLVLHRLLHGEIEFERVVAGNLWQARIPARLLVPLIENAMTHGARDESGRRFLRLEARESEGQLEIVLTNPAPPEAHRSGGLGSGLESVRRLLAITGGDRARLNQRVEQGLFTIEIVLPR